MGGRGGAGNAHSGGGGTSTAAATAPAARAEPDNGEPAPNAIAAAFRKQRTSTTETFPAMTKPQKNAMMRIGSERGVSSAEEKELAALGMFNRGRGMFTELGKNWWLGHTSGHWLADIQRFE